MLEKGDNSVYQRNGFSNRHAYLKNLAEENGIDFETVCAVANILGPDEDFDGLVSSLEFAPTMDFEECGDW